MLAIYIIMQCKLGQAINLCCYSLAAGVICIDSIFNVFNTTGLINLCCYNVQLDDYGCAIPLDWSLSICVLSVWLVLYILCTVRLCNFIMPRLWYFICYVFDIQLWLCLASGWLGKSYQAPLNPQNKGDSESYISVVYVNVLALWVRFCVRVTPVHL